MSHESYKSFVGVSAMGPTGAYPPTNVLSATRPVGQIKSRVEALNRVGNILSEDAHAISSEIDRIAGQRPAEPSAGIKADRPSSCDMDSFQEQLDRLDRLSQFVHEQVERLRSI